MLKKILSYGIVLVAVAIACGFYSLMYVGFEYIGAPGLVAGIASWLSLSLIFGWVMRRMGVGK